VSNVRDTENNKLTRFGEDKNATKNPAF